MIPKIKDLFDLDHTIAASLFDGKEYPWEVLAGIKDYILEKHGVKVSSLYIAQVKEKYGIIERDCYNKPKSPDAKQPQCPEDKEKLIVLALKYFQMI